MTTGGDLLALGVDGGGSSCCARLSTLDGVQLGEGTGGPIRLGVKQSSASVLLAQGLITFGADRLALVGGLAAAVQPRPADGTRGRLAPARGDAIAGVLRLAGDFATTHRDAASRPR
jgi:N-acetylglucosamine kinase-like BadF-type ATPase